MKKLTILASAVVLALSSQQATAQEENSGCGVGSQVMDGQSGKGAHIAAAFLNGLFSNTISMTTGGFGCDPTQMVEVEEAREIFVAQNLDQLSTDAAKGSGDYLRVLATLMGVPKSELPHFNSLAQSQFDTLFHHGGDAASLINSLQLAMANDVRLAPHTMN